MSAPVRVKRKYVRKVVPEVLYLALCRDLRSGRSVVQKVGERYIVGPRVEMTIAFGPKRLRGLVPVTEWEIEPAQMLDVRQWIRQ